ncbi:MAG: FIST C-terminal domain-containing protein [Candidatus Competibacteraceae bacterium]|nr:FIST C-terminal domain-containing protein [Candidatus Competibacteraceae bacterium]
MNSNRYRVTLGQARQADAFTAGKKAAIQARNALSGESPGWALAFGGGRHDAAALLHGFRIVLGDIPIIGGCGVGLITVEAATLTGYECGLLLFPAVLNPVAIALTDNLRQGERVAGQRLGQALRESIFPNATVLLFYDSIHSGPPPVLHVGSQLMDGVYEGLGEERPMLVGAGTLADMELTDSYIFDGREFRKHAAVAIVLPPMLTSHGAIMHGCYPASDFLEITRIDGARVLELNNRPALIVAAERLGIPREQLAMLHPPHFSLTLGEKYGNPFAPFSEDQYVNRLVVAADLSDNALILFEADFQVGSQVQLMAIDSKRMIDSAYQQTRALLERLDGQQLLFGLYIDCAGRSTAFSGLEDDETAPVREQVGVYCPLLGFYSGVEIAPLFGRSRPLDWTGVLVVFTLLSPD